MALVSSSLSAPLRHDSSICSSLRKCPRLLPNTSRFVLCSVVWLPHAPLTSCVSHLQLHFWSEQFIPQRNRRARSPLLPLLLTRLRQLSLHIPLRHTSKAQQALPPHQRSCLDHTCPCDHGSNPITTSVTMLKDIWTATFKALSWRSGWPLSRSVSVQSAPISSP